MEAGTITVDHLRAYLNGDLRPEQVDGWYLCGPEPLVHMVTEVLAECGAPPETVHTELFIAAAAATTVTEGDSACALSATLGTEEVTVTTTPGQTVLAALLDNGVPAPYSCMGGACGTCRARVAHGQAAMDQNHALGDDEIAQGYVLTCQARPRTSRLDVDFNA